MIVINSKAPWKAIISDVGYDRYVVSVWQWYDLSDDAVLFEVEYYIISTSIWMSMRVQFTNHIISTQV